MPIHSRPCSFSFVLFVVWLLSLVDVSAASGYRFSTLAGKTSGPGNVDGTGAAARFSAPVGVAMDSAGNVYVADTENQTIRKITIAGVVSTLAGTAGSRGSVDGTGAAARFNDPTGVAVDSTGNVYVADASNHTIRKITPLGVVSTLAGTAGSMGGDDGTGAAASFVSPNRVAVDSAGNVYVSESGNHTIRKITPAGVVSTLAGSALEGSGSADGTGAAARFGSPTGVALDSAGNVYVADNWNHTIRKITPAGVVSTLAGAAGSSGSTDGTGAAARFNSPNSVAVDSAGNVYVADSGNHTIRKITATAVVSTLAGASESAGSADGTGAAARFNGPSGAAVDSAGNVYVADTQNCTIRKITAAGVVSTLAGPAGGSGSTDGTGAAARFRNPFCVAVDSAGNVYVSDTENHTIRKITAAGVVSTLAGLAGSSGSEDGTGAVARFNGPSGVTVDNLGNVYVVDTDNQTIRKITAQGAVSTMAGSVESIGNSDGTGAAARFFYPFGATVDSALNVYVADTLNSSIRKITPARVVSTFVGESAQLQGPEGMAVDQAGYIYLADKYSHTIRKITPQGAVSTLAGLAGSPGSADGTGAAARFYFPTGVAVDGAGNVFVADTGNHTIRKITAAGVVTTIGGIAGQAGGVDTLGSSARFSTPTGIAVDTHGVLYIADYNNNTIRKGVPIAGEADFNQDGSEDLLWSQKSTGERGLWLLDNGSYTGSSAMLPTVPTEWVIVGSGDFSQDGSTDILWQNTSTGDVYVWYMNSATYTGNGALITTIAPAWRVAGAGDFNADGKPDILWQNLSTGDRYIWFMDGIHYTDTYAFLGNVPANWLIVGAGDMDQDGKCDLLWRNTGTGEVGEWLMEGAAVKETLTFGSIPLNWSLRQVLDLNSDGKPDLLWTNLQNGELGAWLMDGPTYSGTAKMLPTVPTSWLPGTSYPNGAP